MCDSVWVLSGLATERGILTKGGYVRPSEGYVRCLISWLANEAAVTETNDRTSAVDLSELILGAVMPQSF